VAGGPRFFALHREAVRACSRIWRIGNGAKHRKEQPENTYPSPTPRSAGHPKNLGQFGIQRVGHPPIQSRHGTASIAMPFDDSSDNLRDSKRVSDLPVLLDSLFNFSQEIGVPPRYFIEKSDMGSRVGK